MSTPTTVEVAVFHPGVYDVVTHRVKIAQDADATLNENLMTLRKLWKTIEDDLAARGLV